MQHVRVRYVVEYSGPTDDVAYRAKLLEDTTFPDIKVRVAKYEETVLSRCPSVKLSANHLPLQCLLDEGHPDTHLYPPEV